MTSEPTAEERISEWLHDEASGQLPDWVLAATFERTRADRQRRMLRRWRSPSMNTPMKIVLLMAISLAALVGISFAVGQQTNQTKVVLPSPNACSTSDSQLSPAPGPADASPVAGTSPVQFLWAATGQAGDPMDFTLTPAWQGGHIALDPLCRVWVADHGHDRFAIFQPDGTFVEYWGAHGKGEGQFNLRNRDGDAYGDIAFAPDGSFYVLDVGNLRVQHFDSDRRFVGSWSGPSPSSGGFFDPRGLAVDSLGAVHVLDAARNVLETYTSDGTLVGSFIPLPGASNFVTNGLALDAEGNTYVIPCCGAVNEVWKFDPNGRRVATIDPVGLVGSDYQLNGIAVDTAGRVFVGQDKATTGDKVKVFSPNGQLLTSFGKPGQGDGQFGFGYEFGIALDGHGSVYVTDGAASRLEKFRLLPPLAP